LETKTAVIATLTGRARLAGAGVVPDTLEKDCDPSSVDPDVGILSCGAEYQCVSDDTSELGGVCTSISRELQDAVCEPCPNGALDEANYGLSLTFYGEKDPTVTCGLMALYLMYNVTSTSDACNYIAPVLQANGCCEGGPYYQCDLCDGGTIQADVVVPIDNMTLTCLDVAALTPDPECTTYAPLLASLCCGAAAAPPASSVVPSTAPGETTTPPPEETTTPPGETPPPSGGSSAAAGAMWSTSTIVSMIGLVVSTVGATVLN
jgi:hypothetical protein